MSTVPHKRPKIDTLEWKTAMCKAGSAQKRQLVIRVKLVQPLLCNDDEIGG